MSIITALPAAPARTDAPAVFIAKADAFLAALATMATQINSTLDNAILGTLLTTVTASNSATVDVEGIDGSYDMYYVVATGITGSVSGQDLMARIKMNGAYVTTASYTSCVTETQLGAATSPTTNGLGGSSAIRIANALTGGTGSDRWCDFEMALARPGVAAQNKKAWWRGVATYSTGNHKRVEGGAEIDGSTYAMTGIRFYMASGNIATGTFRLYGQRNS